jgi:hypothetical protein
LKGALEQCLKGCGGEWGAVAVQRTKHPEAEVVYALHKVIPWCFNWCPGARLHAAPLCLSPVIHGLIELFRLLCLKCAMGVIGGKNRCDVM